jgi:FtsH-binding integral membrane protein
MAAAAPVQQMGFSSIDRAGPLRSGASQFLSSNQLQRPNLSAYRPQVSPQQARRNIIHTYAYAAGSLGMTAATAALCFAVPVAGFAAAPVTHLGLGVVAPALLARFAISIEGDHRVLKHLLWGAFGMLSGYGLSITGSASLAVLGPTFFCTVFLVAAIYYMANRPAPMGRTEGPSRANRANQTAALQGLTVGGALTQFMTPSRGGQELQTVLSAFSLFLGWVFTAQHMEQLRQEAFTEADYDPMAQSITLYVNVVGIFWSLGRFWLPPPGTFAPA